MHFSAFHLSNIFSVKKDFSGSRLGKSEDCLLYTSLARIKEINPNLILIAGGVDYGERDTAVYNAEMIRTLGLKTPVVYAGNIENQDEMKLIFDEESGQYLYLVDNVYPKIDTLNVEPCRKVIQDAFEDHITHAPGMEPVSYTHLIYYDRKRQVFQGKQ